MTRVTFNYLRTALLLIIPGILPAGVGYVIGGWSGVAVLTALYTVLMTLALQSADKMILASHGALDIPEAHARGLHALTGELARRAGVSTPALYLLPKKAPQMLVTGTTASRGSIALSEGLLGLLTTEELAAVIGHGVHHLRSRETLPMTTMALLLEVFASIGRGARPSHFLRPVLSGAKGRDSAGPDGLSGPLALAAVPFIRSTVYKSRQFRADAASVNLIGNASSLCSALGKIEAATGDLPAESPSLATVHLHFCGTAPSRGWRRLLETQPSIAERVRRLETLSRRPVVSSRLKSTQRSLVS